MRHQCWSLVIVSTERGRQVGDEVLHHGLPRSRESPVYRRGHGESVFACASTLVRRGEYRAQTGIWRLLNFVSVRTIKGRSIEMCCLLGFCSFVSSHHQTGILMRHWESHQPDSIYCQLVAPNTALSLTLCRHTPVTTCHLRTVPSTCIKHGQG